MNKFIVHKNAVRFLRPKRIVLSEKAQAFLRYSGYLDYIEKIAELRDQYLVARTEQSIDRISTFEMETILREGRQIPSPEEMRKARKPRRK